MSNLPQGCYPVREVLLIGMPFGGDEQAMEQYPVTSSILTYWSLSTKIADRAVSGNAGLNLTQYRTLKYLFGCAGEPTVGGICSDLGLSRSQAGKTASGLVDLGLVRKQPRFSGDYAAHLLLTNGGVDTLMACDNLVARAMVEFMLPAKPLFDSITKSSLSWIAAGLGPSRQPRRELFGKTLDIGDVIRLGLEGAARIEGTISSACRKEGVTKLEYRVLLAMQESPDRTRAADLADALVVKQPNLSVASRHLIACKLIEPEPEPRDSRSTFLRITKAGGAACSRITEPVNEAMMKLSGNDSSDARAMYVEISRICVDAERERKRN